MARSITVGRPTRRITRSAIDCDEVLTATHSSSPVRYTLRGALLTERLPRRCCTVPSWSNVVIWAPSIIMIGSMIATSTTWPRPVASARAQGGGDGEARRQGGDAVGEPERRQRGRPVGFAGDGGEPAHRLGDGAEPWLPRHRPELPEGSDAGDDEPGVGGMQLGWADAPPLERAGAEVLDQHVRSCRQPQQQVGTLRP